MVLVAERMEQVPQGDTRVPPTKDGEPGHGHGGPATTPLSEGPDPAQVGPEEPRPSGNPEPLGAQGPDVVDKGELDHPEASLLCQRSPPRGKGQVS